MNLRFKLGTCQHINDILNHEFRLDHQEMDLNREKDQELSLGLSINKEIQGKRKKQQCRLKRNNQ